VSSFPKTKRPTSARILDAWVRDRARAEGQVTERIRLGVGYMVVSAVLARMRAVDGSPLFILKGGVAMQLRFEHRARSSADIDMIFRRDLALLDSTLADAPRYPIGAFAVRAVGKPHVLGPTGAVRQALAVLYGRTPWSRIYLEVSPPEGGSADIERLEILPPSPDLTVFGLDPIDPIPCMSVAYQIAQKLHACTEVKTDEANHRFTDLLDLQLLEELVLDWPAVRGACEEVFRLRGKHAWPPAVTVYPSWIEAYAATAVANDFPVTDVDEASAKVTKLIARIAIA
jgi:hypothetical protein